MIQNSKLECGLEVVHYSIPSTRFVDVALAIGVGTRFEPEELMGISHFVEHILFRGCRLLPTSYQLNVEFDRIGEGLNAMTQKEFTMFTTKVPVDELPQALRLMAAVVSEPLFLDVDTEREIILEEILEELDGKGRDIDIDNISRRLIFGKHSLAYPVLGREKTIRNVTEENLRDYHAAYYAPANMVLGIAGGSAWPKSRQAAEKAFASSFSGRLARTGQPAELRIKDAKPGFHFISDPGSQVEVVISFFMPGERFPGELARMFLSRVLDDGISSRLQRTICERHGLLYDISCGIESFTDIALFDVEFSVSPKKLVEVVEVIVRELRLLKDALIPRAEFDIVGGRFRRDVYATSESSRGMAHLLAEAFLLRLPMPIDPREYEARLDELTPESVREEARRVFTNDNCAFVAKGRVSPAVRKAVKALLRRL